MGPVLPIIAIGSVFGVGTASATFLGMSTLAATGLCGMSLATTVLGGVTIVGAVGAGTYLHTRKNDKIIDQTSSPVYLTDQQLHPQFTGPSAPKWYKINMSPKMFEELRTISSADFQKRKEKFICPITM